MSLNWGPHFIVPSKTTKVFSGIVRLRESYDEEVLRKELEELGISGAIVRVTNPWYYHKKGDESWIKIGESDDRDENFPVKWDTSRLQNGAYQILGLMHVFVKRDDQEKVLARQSIVDVTIKN